MSKIKSFFGKILSPVANFFQFLIDKVKQFFTMLGETKVVRKIFYILGYIPNSFPSIIFHSTSN